MYESKYKYSIIIPHYNTPDLLVRCIKSIPYRSDLQVIVVDDNSPGADKYLDKYPELSRPNLLFTIVKEKSGAGHARNVALQYVRGEMVLFSDADDFFSDNFLSILNKYIDNKADLVYFNTKQVFSDNVGKEYEDARCKQRLFDEYYRDGDINIFRFCYTEPWGKIYNTEYIRSNEIEFEETKVANDYLFSVKAGCLTDNILIDETVLYIVTRRTGSLSYSYSDTLEKVLIRLNVSKHVELFLNSKGYFFSPMLIDALMALLLIRKPIEFVKEFCKLKADGISRSAFVLDFIEYVFLHIFCRKKVHKRILPSYKKN